MRSSLRRIERLDQALVDAHFDLLELLLQRDRRARAAPRRTSSEAKLNSVFMTITR